MARILRYNKESRRKAQSDAILAAQAARLGCLLVPQHRRFRSALCADGRLSIALERRIRASLLQILFSIRSERQLMEQMQYNLCSAGSLAWGWAALPAAAGGRQAGL